METRNDPPLDALELIAFLFKELTTKFLPESIGSLAHAQTFLIMDHKSSCKKESNDQKWASDIALKGSVWAWCAGR